MLFWRNAPISTQGEKLAFIAYYLCAVAAVIGF